jgi:hypothetical protein
MRFRFLELPAELRIQIYECVIYKSPPQPINMTGFMGVKWSNSTLKRLHRNHSLLCVSRQVYREYSDIVAKRGEFKFVFRFGSRFRPLEGLKILKMVHKCRMDVNQLFNSQPLIPNYVQDFISVLGVVSDICISWQCYNISGDKVQWEDVAKDLLRKLEEIKPLKRLQVIVMDRRGIQRAEAMFLGA